MTNEQIKHSIETDEIKLGIWKKFSHYEIVGFLFIIPITLIFINLKDYFQGNPKPFREGEILFIIIPSILGLLFYLLQKTD